MNSQRRDFILRSANPEDISAILGLIKELADYERAADQVQANEEDLLQHGFGTHPSFEVYLAEITQSNQKRIVGFALFFKKFSTWTGKNTLHLEDLYVQPQYRNQGIGKALFAKLAAICVERDYQRYEWNVLDWNQPAIEFYQAHHAEAQKEWIGFRMTGDALKKLATSI